MGMERGKPEPVDSPDVFKESGFSFIDCESDLRRQILIRAGVGRGNTVKKHQKVPRRYGVSFLGIGIGLNRTPEGRQSRISSGGSDLSFGVEKDLRERGDIRMAAGFVPNSFEVGR